MAAFSTSMLLAFRTTMSSDDDDDVRKIMCQAKLPPPSYESASSKSIVVAPVRHHQIPQQLTATAGPQSVDQRSTSGSNPDDNSKVAKASRSILDNMTEDTFDASFKQIVTCGIEQPEHVCTLMSEVFAAATSQHPSIPVYADLCAKLEQDPHITAAVEVSGCEHNYKRLLLTQSATAFEQLFEPSDASDSLDGEAGLQRKQKALGNIKLMGHLILNGMLNSKLFIDFTEQLMQKRSTCPEALESLAALLMVAAPTFDTAEWKHYDRLQTCFSSMKKLTKDKTLAPRGRLLLRDVLDARDAGWPTSTKNTAILKAVMPDLDSLAEQVQDGAKPTAPLEAEKSVKEAFDLRAFRRNLAAILGELTSTRNVSGAVGRVRLLQVPVEVQAEQYSDLITRIVEEKRGPARRCAMAFAAGLAVADQPAFDREQCLAGIVSFFEGVYPDLCNEVARLPAIVRSELTPTLYSVFPKAEIDGRLPPGVRF